jgi:hypothetical protein
MQSKELKNEYPQWVMTGGRYSESSELLQLAINTGGCTALLSGSRMDVDAAASVSVLNKNILAALWTGAKNSLKGWRVHITSITKVVLCSNIQT